MKCSDVIHALEERWDPSFALEWDNVGLLVGREDREVRRILVALDASDEVIAQAEKYGSSDHPPPADLFRAQTGDLRKFYRKKDHKIDTEGYLLLCHAHQF